MDKNLINIEKSQREYYNKIARIYDEHYSSPYALKYRFWVYDTILKNIDLKDKKVLDAMCGGGEATYYMLKKGAKVIGLDISENCCKLYKQYFPNFQVVCASILNTGLPDNYFDFIITDSLHHLFPYLRNGLDEIYRILKPQGYFCCWEPNANSFLNCFRKLWYKSDKKFFEKNEQAIDIRKLQKELNEKFEFLKLIYGGNIAYLFVNCPMIFRIPLKLVKFYYKPLIFFEKITHRILPEFLSLWVLCLMKKK